MDIVIEILKFRNIFEKEIFEWAWLATPSGNAASGIAAGVWPEI